MTDSSKPDGFKFLRPERKIIDQELKRKDYKNVMERYFERVAKKDELMNDIRERLLGYQEEYEDATGFHSETPDVCVEAADIIDKLVVALIEISLTTDIEGTWRDACKRRQKTAREALKAVKGE